MLSHLRLNNLIGKYKVSNATAQSFSYKGTFLNDRHLIWSECEGNYYQKIYFKNISIRSIDLLELIEENKLTEDFLYQQQIFPRDIARLTVDYLRPWDSFFHTRPLTTTLVEADEEPPSKKLKL